VAEQMSFDEFRVELGHLHNAIGDVKRERDTIHEAMASIGNEFALVKESWDSPSEQTFDAVQQWLMRVTQDLENILQDSIGRMQQAYDNYHQAEETNTRNNTPQHSGGGGGRGGGGGNHDNGGSHHQTRLRSGMQEPTGAEEPLKATLRSGQIAREAAIPATPALLRGRALD
jgi:WXG100 family type VII secretion target